MRTTSIIKSHMDKLSYRGLVLDNNIRCVLVSDPNTTISSASMNVHVGSLSDPKDFQGLAHFLEHMLFLGTEKYPLESTYKTLISENGGTCNAYTSHLDTNYYFQIKNHKMEEALDVFSQFFISPLFNEDCTNREIHAVDSEAAKNMIIDNRRFHHLTRHLSDPDSIYNKYSTGDLRTLQKEGLRDALFKFHQKHYSADRMDLVVYHNKQLDEMEAEVSRIFSSIPNKNTTTISFSGEPSPYSRNRKSKLVKILPVNDKHSITVSFILPEVYSKRYDKPLSYISYVLGHECKGSLADMIVEKNLGLGVSCGYSMTKDLFTSLNINVTLTEKGLREYEEVLGIIGEHIREINKIEPQEWVHHELKETSEIRFRYKSNGKPSDVVVSISSTLPDCELEEVLKYDYIVGKFDRETIKTLLKEMVSDNCIVYISSKSLDASSFNLTEPIYSTQYSYDDLSKNAKNLIDGKFFKHSSQIKFPQPNRFMPKDISLIDEISENRTKHPQKIGMGVDGNLWYKFDDSFGLPKSFLNAVVFDNTFDHFNKPENRIYFSLWCSVFSFIFRPTNYEFSVANAYSSVSSSKKGISISVGSFSSSMQATLRGVLETMNKVKSYSNKDQFDDILLKFKMEYRNELRSQPYETAMEMLGDTLVDNVIDLEQTLAFIDTITWEKFVEFKDKIFTDKIGFRLLVEGNIKKEDAIQAYDEVAGFFKKTFKPKGWIQEENIPDVKIKQLDLTNKFIVSKQAYLPSEKNSATVVYYQIGNKKYQRAVFRFISDYIKNKFFDELRTKQQLGYIVAGGLTIVGKTYGFRFIIQGHVKDANHFAEQTEAFLESTMISIRNIRQEEIDDIKKGIIANLEKPFNNLTEQTESHLEEIKKMTYEFDLRENFIEEIKKVDRDMIIDEFDKIFFRDARIIELHVVSKNGWTQYQQTLSARCDKKKNISVFKKSQLLKRKLLNIGDLAQKL